MKKSIIELTEKEVVGVSGGEWEWMPLPVLQEAGKCTVVILIQIAAFVIGIGIITCLSVKRKRDAKRSE